jgi:hypothetical protein
VNSELLRGERDLTVAAGNGASGCDRVSDVEGDGSSWGVGELGSWGEWEPELATAAWERKV